MQSYKKDDKNSNSFVNAGAIIQQLTTVQEQFSSPEEYLTNELLSVFDNKDPRTRKNIVLIAKKAINSGRQDLVYRIKSEVSQDSNENTKSRTAVFIDRCKKELGIKSIADIYSSEDKWIRKALYLSEDDIFCNTDILLKWGRYEKKLVNMKEIEYDNSALTVSFEIIHRTHDSGSQREILNKPFGKIDLLLEMMFQQKFMNEYAKKESNHEDTLLDFENDPHSKYKRPFIILPRSYIRNVIWGHKRSGNMTRVEECFLRLNRESLVLQTEKEKAFSIGTIKITNKPENIRPYEIETIKVQLKTSQGEREATAYKVRIHELFFEILKKHSSENVLIEKEFETIKSLSEREIQLYLHSMKWRGISNVKPFLYIDKFFLMSLGIDPEIAQRDINIALKRSVKNFNKKIQTIILSLSLNENKIYIEKPNK